MTGGFVKLHRQVKGHWVTTRPEWFQAWTYILMSANYETGRVNLTEVYRELGDLFDNRAWRYLIEKLQKDGMLSDLEGRNLGSRAGFQQTAKVANWSKYHENSRGATGGASAPQHAEQNAVTDETKDVSARSQRGASAEHYAESNKNTFQEDNLLTPPTPPVSAVEPPRREGGNYDPNILQSQHADVFRQLIKVKSVSGVNGEQFKVWCSRVLKDCRLYGDTNISFLLGEMAVNYASFTFPWKWYAKQLSTLTTQKASENVPRAAPRFAPGDHARTPDGAERVILDVCPNGMVVFEDDSLPVHLAGLEPVMAAVA